VRTYFQLVIIRGLVLGILGYSGALFGSQDRLASDLQRFADVKFIGTWSEGSLNNGVGYYSEEDFLPNGTYCRLHISLSNGQIKAASGTWSWSSDEKRLQLTYTYQPAKPGHASGQTRLNVAVFKSFMRYEYPGAKDVLAKSRVSRNLDDRWCELANQLR